MLKINYCRDGVAISDYEVEKFVDDTIKSYLDWPVVTEVKVASEILITVFQERMLRGDIEYGKIKFYIDDEEIECHPYKGFILPENKKFGIYFGEYVMRVSKILFEKCKKDRANKSI